jgi:hypothetical protein
VVKQEGSIYKNDVIRTFNGCTQEQSEAIEDLYEKIGADIALKRSNWYYKLQEQACLQVIPDNKGQLQIRVLKPHQYDVVNSMIDPTKAEAYIVSAFDRQDYSSSNSQRGLNNPDYRDSDNQNIADPDDFKEQLNRFVVWSESENFIMNKDGSIVSEVLPNKLGILPFVDIAEDKDDAFFIVPSLNTTNFCIQFGAMYSSLVYIMQMQGFAIAYLIASENVMPQSLAIGPGKVIRLPVSPEDGVKPEFGFANPSADLKGSQEVIEGLLSTWLSTKGLSPKTISSKPDAKTYASGFERLLAMIDDLAPSVDDYSIFEKAEGELFEIIKQWVNVYGGSNLLYSKEIKAIGTIPQDAYVSVEFQGPQSIKTTKEELEEIQLKIELGLASKVDGVMELYDINEEDAILKLEKINGYKKQSEQVGQEGQADEAKSQEVMAKQMGASSPEMEDDDSPEANESENESEKE